MKIIKTFSFISILLMFAACSKEQDVSITHAIHAVIDGYVFDAESGAPLDGARVTISDKATQTNAHGYYKISGLATGEYCIKIEKEGYVTTMDCSSISIDGSDYYGSEIQTSHVSHVLPADNLIELTFVYNNGTDINPDWQLVPSGVHVNVSYIDNTILNSISTRTVNNSGFISLNNMAFADIQVVMHEITESAIYRVNKTITAEQLQNYNGTIRVQITHENVVDEGFDL